jgi:hypothetical protein
LKARQNRGEISGNHLKIYLSDVNRGRSERWQRRLPRRNGLTFPNLNHLLCSHRFLQFPAELKSESGTHRSVSSAIGSEFDGREEPGVRIARFDLRSSLRSMMEDQKLIGRERQLRVGLALVVGEFDFVGAVQQFHDGADLAAQEAVRRHV